MSTTEVFLESSIECPAWTQVLPQAEERARALAQAVLAEVDIGLGEDPAEISLVLADDVTVRDLNREWRGKDKATNVLSFAALDDDEAPRVPGAPVLLGDIVLAYETCAAEAADQGKSLENHYCHLVLHGLLHLLGYDHEESDEDAEEMEELEVSILAAFGIPNPYEGLED